MSEKTVAVVYYSTYGHVLNLAREIVKGLERSGVNVKLYQAPETLPLDVLNKMGAPPKPADIPVVKPDDLKEADGILFGMPTRFGSVPAQMKSFFDSCGQLWMADALYGKFAGTFFSTGNLGGGQETTALSCVPFFAHLGMIFVPIGYKSQHLTNNSEVHGGSPWGAGTVAGGDGSRQASQLELELAEFQGFEFGNRVQGK